ncbi:MAG: cell wall-binding repeat-containing protein [Clostridioides sp.]|nr:cell wall-binding repeat-containing protein [Clostridioides sp.]
MKIAKHSNKLKRYLALTISVALFATTTIIPASAEITHGDKKSEIQADPNVVIRGKSDEDDKNANDLLKSASWKDKSKYYLIYPDAGAANADFLSNGGLTKIVYDGEEVECSVVVGNDFGAGELNKIFAHGKPGEFTAFFKGGEYINAGGVGSWKFSKGDMALIGLEDNVVLKAGKDGSEISNQSIGIVGSNILFRNLAIDGDNVGMRKQSNSSGRYFIKILQGANGVVFDDVSIQNMKEKTSDKSEYNVAINIIGAKNVLFNDVTIKNTKAKLGYSSIQVNNGSENIYFNDLSLDSVEGGANYVGGVSYPFIKIEDGSSGTHSNVGVFFTGSLNFSNMDDKFKNVWIENYMYDTVAFPSETYRYAQLRNKNGSWTTNYIGLNKLIPATATDYAIFDLKDNTFVVKKGDSKTESQQIQNIIDTVAFIRKIKGITDEEEYNIKYEVGSELEKITAPEIKVSSKFATTYLGNWEKIKFNIIPVSDVANDITTSSTKESEIIEFKTTSEIELPETNNRYTVFNIDFDKSARCTLKEVVDGVKPLAAELDSNKNLYGTSNNLTYSEYGTDVDKDPIVANTDIDTFQNCVFTSLVQKISVSDTNPNPPANVKKGDVIQLEARMTDDIDNSFTHEGIQGKDINKDKANDRDSTTQKPSVKWFSTNTSVATVDENGKVKAVGAGNADIIAKAADEFNDGEIEKPWAVYSLTNVTGTIDPPPHKDKDRVVVIANGEKYTDVLTASVLAHEKLAPILLTSLDSIDAKTIAEINRIRPDEIIISGGPASVAEKVRDQLTQYKVRRVSGPDRYATAVEIGNEVRSITGNFKDAFIVDGTNFPDAMTVSSLAAYRRAPILLTKPDTLNKDSEKALKDWEIKNMTIGGEVLSVSKDIETSLKDSIKIPTVKRIGGTDRYKTAVLLGNELRGLTGVDKNAVLVDGTKFPDALTISSLAEYYSEPVLLSAPNKLTATTEKAISDWKITKVTIAGGETSISKEIEDSLKQVMNSVVRIAGVNRYETAVKICEIFTDIAWK